MARRVWVVATPVTLHPVGTVIFDITLDAVVDFEKVVASPTDASRHMLEAVALEASVAVGAVGIDIAISLAQPEFFALANYISGDALEVEVGKLVRQCPPSSSSSEGEFGRHAPPAAPLPPPSTTCAERRTEADKRAIGDIFMVAIVFYCAWYFFSLGVPSLSSTMSQIACL